MSWKKVSGVVCDRKLSAKVKGKMFPSVIKPAMLHGMKTVAMTAKQMERWKWQLEMVRWALGVTRKDKIKNEYVRGPAKIAKSGDKLHGTRSGWYIHVKKRRLRWEKNDIETAIPDKKRRGRPKRRWIDLVRKDMEMVGAKEGDEVERAIRRLSRCGNPE